MNDQIEFLSEGIDFELANADAVADWISNIVSRENMELGYLNYMFCDDEKILEVNKQYLDHDYYTDIITFDQSEEEGLIEADIFISIDTVKSNSKEMNTSFEEELHRVIIHGVLHLCGYGDKTTEEQKLMRKKEDECLTLRPI